MTFDKAKQEIQAIGKIGNLPWVEIDALRLKNKLPEGQLKEDIENTHQELISALEAAKAYSLMFTVQDREASILAHRESLTGMKARDFAEYEEEAESVKRESVATVEENLKSREQAYAAITSDEPEALEACVVEFDLKMQVVKSLVNKLEDLIVLAVAELGEEVDDSFRPEI